MGNRFYTLILEVNHLPRVQDDPLLTIEALIELAEEGSATTAFEIAEQAVRRRYNRTGAGYSLHSKRVEPVASVHGIEGQTPDAVIEGCKVWRMQELRN